MRVQYLMTLTRGNLFVGRSLRSNQRKPLSVNWTVNGIFKTRADPSTFYAHWQIDFPRESSVTFIIRLDGKDSLAEGTKGSALFLSHSSPSTFCLLCGLAVIWVLGRWGWILTKKKIFNRIKTYFRHQKIEFDYVWAFIVSLGGGR